MLKKIIKWMGVTLLLFIVVLTVTVLLRQHIKFDAPYPAGIRASKDSAVFERGKYLVLGPAHCADCHGAPGTQSLVNQGKEVPLSGGYVFELPIGKLNVRNITSDNETGIGRLSDEEIARTLRYGVGSDGRVLLDIMPFHNTSDDDLTAIISYLRSLQPVKNKVPRSSYNVLGKVINAFVLKPVGPVGEVLRSVKPDSTASYGKYLATSVANCRGCHTDQDLKTGAFIGKDFAGGFKMESDVDKNQVFYSPNLTPDKGTGHLVGWSEDVFLKRFRKGKIYPQSPMPWGPFGRMSDMEIIAIYKYLQTVAPVENKIASIVEVIK